MVFPIEVGGIVCPQRTHRTGNRLLLLLHQNMIMVGYQTKTVDQHPIPLAGFPQAFQHLIVIVFIPEKFLPAIATVDAMEKCSWITDSAASTHRPPPTPVRRLAICPFIVIISPTSKNIQIFRTGTLLPLPMPSISWLIISPSATCDHTFTKRFNLLSASPFAHFHRHAPLLAPFPFSATNSRNINGIRPGSD